MGDGNDFKTGLEQEQSGDFQDCNTYI